MSHKLSDFLPQEHNANGHTQAGMSLLRTSIERNRWAGALTAVLDPFTGKYRVIDGSARLKTAYALDDFDIEPITIHTNGDRPVVVIRDDIPSPDDPMAIELAIAVNRVAEVNLSWNDIELEQIEELGEVPLDIYFSVDELEVIGEDGDRTEDDEDGELKGDRPDHSIRIALTEAQYNEWKIIKESLGESDDSRAFVKLMQG